jgi:hypothetical protein
VQRLRVEHNSEQGGIAVIVALLMVVLLGFAAVAVDVGALYAEQAQLQNGADAAAMAIAQSCAKNPADTTNCIASSPLAVGLNNGNALDGKSNIKSVALDKTNKTIKVTSGAQETGKTPNEVSLFFARALGMKSAEVNASSTVAWGTPSKGRLILPLAIAHCKLNLSPGALTGTEQVLDMDSGGCGEIPGGFSWIKEIVDDGKCSVTVSAGQASNSGIWFMSDTGASVPSLCTSSDVATLNNQTVLLPLYDVATGNGSSGMYYVKGFAAFHVTGYHFESHSWPSGSIKNKTMRGYFEKFVSLSDAFELGSAPDYGTSLVRFSQ